MHFIHLFSILLPVCFNKFSVSVYDAHWRICCVAKFAPYKCH